MDLSALTGCIRLIRPSHWVKNSFVLAPLVFSGKIGEIDSIYHAVYTFLIFCAASSSVYIINDWKDIKQDQAHPLKSKTRPLASGQISLPHALAMLLICCSFVIFACFLVPQVAFVVLSYLALNVAYTFYLKHIVIADIFSISAGFVLRVQAGALALSVELSSWMFASTFFLALYLASIKRQQELVYENKEQTRPSLKQYSSNLITKYADISMTGALICYSLFVMTSKSDLIITIPLVVYGLFRYQYCVQVLKKGESPTDTLLSDVPLLLSCLLWMGICLWIFTHPVDLY